eukprot:jgi/Galph1/3105/GphlegSOOS_G1771.1
MGSKKRSCQVLEPKTPTQLVQTKCLLTVDNLKDTYLYSEDSFPSSPVTDNKKEDDCYVSKTNIHSVESEDLLFFRSWLLSLQLSHYEYTFLSHGICSLASLCTLNEERLKEIGILTLGARKKILHNLCIWDMSITPLNSGKDNNNVVQSHLQQSSENEISVKGKKQEQKDSCMLTPNITQDTNQMKTEEKKYYPIFYPKNTREVANSENNSDVITRGHPFWKSVPGTTFTVDSFKAAGQGGSCQFFLSHFHSDHTVGLTSSFRSGRIYCSTITGALIRTQLGVKSEYIQMLNMNQSVDIPDNGDNVQEGRGATVVLIDANHCPGSVMFLFFVWHTRQVILHSGDFRFNIDLHRDIPKVFNRTSVDYLFLDTTYCDTQYNFPSQQEAIEATIEAVIAESFHGRVLFLFGTYQIGKERIFLRVAEQMNEKVFVDKRKYRILRHLQLPPHMESLLTTEPCASRLHVVDMRTVNFKSMMELAKKYSTRYDTLVAFRPSGWTFTWKKDNSRLKRGILTRSQKYNCVLYGVPYSEHCSFSELKEFLSLCQPKRIIPTVNAYNKESADRLRKLLKA